METQEAFDTLLKTANTELDKVQQQGAAYFASGDTAHVRDAADRVERIQGVIQAVGQLQALWEKAMTPEAPTKKSHPMESTHQRTPPRMKTPQEANYLPHIQLLNYSELINFWWITTNPSIWVWDTLFKNQNQTEWFHGRKIAENFSAAKPGDFIFGYQSGPVMKIVALAMITKGLYERNDFMAIDIQGIGPGLLENPVPWSIAKRAIPNSEPVHCNAQGTLFRLSVDEAKTLARLVKEAGNHVNMPEEFKLIQESIWS